MAIAITVIPLPHSQPQTQISIIFMSPTPVIIKLLQSVLTKTPWTYPPPSISCTIIYLVTQIVRNLPAMQETRVRSLDWENPLEKGMATHCNILAGKSHGQRSLAGYGPWACKGLDVTKWLTPFFNNLPLTTQPPNPPYCEAQLKSH